MPLRPAMIDDLPFIDDVEQTLFTEIETYPFPRPIFGYYATRVLGRIPRSPKEEMLLTAMDMRFFMIFRDGHVAGFMVVRNWSDQSDFSRGRFDERDGEVFYIGVVPTFRGTGLGTEALEFALHHHAGRHPDRATLVRFKPACTAFRRLLARAGFGFDPKPQNGRMIGFRPSDPALI